VKGLNRSSTVFESQNRRYQDRIVGVLYFTNISCIMLMNHISWDVYCFGSHDIQGPTLDIT
jgi:hypothetical protein